MRGNLEALLSIAKQAARMAAAIHGRAGQGCLEVCTKTSPTDLVTAVDRESERQLVSVIRQARPDDAIIGEEGTKVKGTRRRAGRGRGGHGPQFDHSLTCA